VVSFKPLKLCPGERAPDTHWIGGWVGLRTGLEAMEKIQILPLPIAIPTELSRLTTIVANMFNIYIKDIRNR
jgi:hypothetical protein